MKHWRRRESLLVLDSDGSGDKHSIFACLKGEVCSNSTQVDLASGFHQIPTARDRFYWRVDFDMSPSRSTPPIKTSLLLKASTRLVTCMGAGIGSTREFRDCSRCESEGAASCTIKPSEVFLNPASTAACNSSDRSTIDRVRTPAASKYRRRSAVWRVWRRSHGRQRVRDISGKP